MKKNISSSASVRQRQNSKKLIRTREATPSAGNPRDLFNTQEELESIAQMLSENPNPVMRASADGQLLYANAASQPLLDDWGTAVGKSLPDELDRTVRHAFAQRLLENIEITCEPKTYVFKITPVSEGPYVNLYGMEITGYKNAQEELRNSESKTKGILRAAPIGIGVVSNRIIMEANQRFCQLLGYTEDEIIGKNSSVLYPTNEEYESVGKAKYEQIEKSGIGTVETRLQRKDGRIIDMVLTSTPIDAKNLSLGVVFTALDITASKRAEEELKKSKQNLHLAVDSSRLGTWQRDFDTGETTWNRYLYELLGRDPNGPAISGETFFDYIHPEDLPRVRSHVKEVFENGDEFIDEFRVIREDKEILWLASHGRIYRDDSGRPIRMAGINFDISECKQAERILSDYRDRLEGEVEERTLKIKKKNRQLQKLNKMIREMSTFTVQAMENERRLLSKEIHDRIGGSLAAIKMLLERRLDNPDNPPSEDIPSIESITGYLSETLKESKRISYEMRPMALDDFGLKAAFSEAIRKFNELYPAIKTDFHYRLSDQGLSEEVKTTIYRITQEALKNVGKHSLADYVKIELAESEDQASTVIEDNGVGFDVEPIFKTRNPLQGYGLLSMKERVKICRGAFRVESSPGKGTRVFASFPKNR